jgi:hypothetical protein
MLKKSILAVFMLLSIPIKAYADSCPEDWMTRTDLNRIIKSNASIQTSKGKINCRVESFYAYMASFVIKCDNNSTIYRSENTCEESDFGDIKKGNCVDFVNLIDSKGSHFKFLDLEIEKALESGQKVTTLICNSNTINFETRFHAYQKSLEFTGKVSVTYEYKPAPKPEGF